MLHVTNGDIAADRIRNAGLPGDVLPWRDALHEGPVPAGLDLHALSAVRARFIAAQGWAELVEVAAELAERDGRFERFAEHDEVVLWFEHDLYDQLQLLQVLDGLAERGARPARIFLVQTESYLGQIPVERYPALFALRHQASPPQLALARRAWAAFRSPDPRGIPPLLDEDTHLLPFLAGALTRHLEELPATDDGLSRSERQALVAIEDGAETLGETYRLAHHEREERIFLGDTVFASYLERMSVGQPALVLFADGSTIRAPRSEAEAEGFWASRARLTSLGREVLAGEQDWLQVHPIDRWLGGVHLTPGHLWRFDRAQGEVTRDGR